MPRLHILGERCNFAGTIPSSLFEHSNLEVLKLEEAGLIGSIPTGLGLLSNLTSLELGKQMRKIGEDSFLLWDC